MRKLILLVAVIVAAVAAPTSFGAGSPHFIKNATFSSIDGSSLVCNFKEAGLSAGAIETISCSANEAVTYECVNNGGKNPSASNKRTFKSSGESQGQFPVDQNGNLVGSLSLAVTSPSALGFSCPNGQTLTLVSVFYTDVRVTDLTSGATASLANQSYVNPDAP